MTKSELETVIKATCPHCAAGVKVRQRADTGEHVHDFAPTGGAFGKVGHTLCLASHLRNSQIAKEATSG